MDEGGGLEGDPGSGIRAYLQVQGRCTGYLFPRR